MLDTDKVSDDVGDTDSDELKDCDGEASCERVELCASSVDTLCDGVAVIDDERVVDGDPEEDAVKSCVEVRDWEGLDVCVGKRDDDSEGDIVPLSVIDCEAEIGWLGVNVGVTDADADDVPLLVEDSVGLPD